MPHPDHPASTRPTLCPSHAQRGVSSARKLIGLLLLPFVLYLLYLVQTRQIEYFEISSGSMEPTLKIGERWLMRKHAKYRTGDVVVLPRPDKPSITLVKRLIAIGPDQVALREGRLFVNGHRSAAPNSDPKQKDEETIPDRTWDLQPGQGFVVGDNRRVSDDSREFGPIAINSIQGVLFKQVE